MNNSQDTVTRLLTALLLCAMLGMTMSTRGQGPNSSATTDQIKTLIDRYTKSVDEADTKLASEIGDNSEDVTFIHPRGHERGWKQVRENFHEKTMGANFSERKLTVHDVIVHAQGDVAWAEFYWDFAAKMKNGGPALDTKGRETQIYRKAGRGWVIVHVHYSGMPVTGERRGF